MIVLKSSFSVFETQFRPEGGFIFTCNSVLVKRFSETSKFWLTFLNQNFNFCFKISFQVSWEFNLTWCLDSIRRRTGERDQRLVIAPSVEDEKLVDPQKVPSHLRSRRKFNFQLLSSIKNPAGLTVELLPLKVAFLKKQFVILWCIKNLKKL